MNAVQYRIEIDPLPNNFSDGATKESGLRENCTSRLTERTEEGLRLDLLRLYKGI